MNKHQNQMIISEKNDQKLFSILLKQTKGENFWFQEMTRVSLTDFYEISEFVDLIYERVVRAHDEVAKIDRNNLELDCHEKTIGSVKGTITSLVSKWSYQDAENELSILKCAVELMYRLLTAHCYVNANKRTAFLGSIAFLEIFNLKINFNPNEYQDLDWVEKLQEIIVIHEEGKISEEEQIDDICDWITKHLLVAHQQPKSISENQQKKMRKATKKDFDFLVANSQSSLDEILLNQDLHDLLVSLAKI